MFQQLGPALRMMTLLTVLTGLIYPGVLTGICELIFPTKANGSLIVRDSHVIGSELIGQNFTRPEYFHPRPSAAGNDGYDPTASGGSNLGPTNQKLHDRVQAAAAQFRKENPDFSGPIPADALTTSASGLDPEISIANAEAQAARVAKARGVSPEVMQSLLSATTERRELGFLGESRINVLKLNLMLDAQYPKR